MKEIFSNYSQKVKKLTDFIINSKSKDSIIYINILSPIREDTYDSKLESFFLFYKNKFKYIKYQFILLIYNYLGFIYNLLKFVKKERFFLSNNNVIHKYKLNKNSKIAYLTSINNINQIRFKYDSYYGCENNDEKYLCIINNGTGIKGSTFFKKLNDSNKQNCILIDYGGDLKTLINSYFIASKVHFYFLLKWFLNPNEFINLSVSVDSISRKSINNLIIFFQIKKVISDLKIEKIITTWEGHPWERLLAKFCNENSISHCGYVHVGPSISQFSAFRFLGSDYEPYKLIVPNQTSKKIIKRIYGNESEIVGSHKANLIYADAEKYIKKINYSQIKQKALLIIPQGTYYEVKKLFNLALKVLDSNLQIRIRFHPCLLNDNRMQKYIDNSTKNMKYKSNIIFSKSSLVQDIKSSSHFLYCASSAAIECLSYGLTPIYYDCGHSLNSLFGYGIPKKFHAKTSNDLRKILDYEIDLKYSKKLNHSHKYPFDFKLF